MRLKRFISSVLLFSFLFPQICFAQSKDISPDPDVGKESFPKVELVPGEKDPGLALSPMKKGQKTPFTGVLLSPSAVANVIVELESIDEKIRIEVNVAVQKQIAECEKSASNLNTKHEADVKILRSDIDDKTRTISAKEEEIKKLKAEQTNPWIWAGIGTAGGIALALLTTFAVSKVTK